MIFDPITVTAFDFIYNIINSEFDFDRATLNQSVSTNEFLRKLF